jgi:very-short-patch-repair endonuclease
VTAEKEQALKVLLDKIPTDIQDLCVTVLGSDARSRQQLRDSVTRIAGVATETADAKEIRRLEEELESLNETIAQLMNRQKRAREVEITTPPLPPPYGGPSLWTPSSMAQWLTEHEAGCRGIQDRIGIDTLPPLTDAEFEELCELLRYFPEEDRTDALQSLPDPDSLPSSALLHSQWLERREIRDALSSMSTVRQEYSNDTALSHGLLEELASELDEWAAWLTLAQGSWLQGVIDDARDELRSQPWRDFCEHFDADSKEIVEELRHLSEYAISVPDNFAGLKEVFEQSLARVRDGKRAGRRFDRHNHEAIDACLIDGRHPETENDFLLLLRHLRVIELRRRLRTRWTNLPLLSGAPELGDSGSIERTLDAQRRQIGRALDWERSASPALINRLMKIGFVPQGAWNPAAIDQAATDVRILRQDIRLRELDSELAMLHDTLMAGAGEEGSSRTWRELLEALDREDGEAWSVATREAQRLRTLAPNARRLHELINSLRTSAPRFANALQSSEVRLSVPLSRAWQWRQVETWLDDLLSSDDAGKLQLEIEKLTIHRRHIISGLVTAKAWASVIESIDDRRRRALNEFVTANAKLGKGKGKYAARWEQQIRAALDRAKDAVPVWIMPIHRVIASFRPTAEPPFDVIIVDEASQVSLLNLPLLGLARQAIVVGDERQTSPENVGLDLETTHQKLDQYLIAIVDRATRFDVNNSLYDLARQQFPQVVRLREHFRCLPRIIEFSSDQWYEGQIIPLRDRSPKPGWKPLGSVFVENGVRRPNDDVNVQEAKAVCALIESMIADEDYTGMNFGVVTLLGTGQPRYIQDQLLDRLGPAVMDERKIRVGDPAGFQGDERDIIILSMVVAHDPERRIGAMTKETDERRINVAASRARNQMWIVHSVMPNDLNPEDPRRKLLEHCLSEVDEARRVRQEDATDSQFERDVLRMIQNAGYTEVSTQYEVGKFRIDIVVEGPEKRLAIECDGDTWHGPDRWEHDRNRQSVLERAGWTFVRIRGSAFYHNRQRALEPLWERLEELGIPKGDWSGTTTDHKIRRVWPRDFPEASSELNNSTEMANPV